MIQNKKCAMRKKVGAKIRALRGRHTMSEFAAMFNATNPTAMTISPSLLSRYERGLVSCPGEKLCKMMEMQHRAIKRE